MEANEDLMRFYDKLNAIEKFMMQLNSRPLTSNQAAQYLSISNSQLYKYTSQRKIPFHKPAGKNLYFFKQELDKWICQNDECRNEECRMSNDENTNKENQLDLFLADLNAVYNEYDEDVEPP